METTQNNNIYLANITFSHKSNCIFVRNILLYHLIVEVSLYDANFFALTRLVDKKGLRLPIKQIANRSSFFLTANLFCVGRK